MKNEITRKLEKLLEKHFVDRSEFFVFECTIGWFGKEIVDCIMYNCAREVTCYEIKSSVPDFRSKHAKTFIGNKNYYIMPQEVYEKVKDEIPKEIGVYIPHVSYGVECLRCIKSSRRVDLKADKEVILSSMVRSMSRDFNRGWRTTAPSEVVYEEVQSEQEKVVQPLW